MRTGVLREKSFCFALNIVELYKNFCKEKDEYVLSKQLLRSGTAIGALQRESEFAESKTDFAHKLAIAQKECNESIYWLELLYKGDYIAEAVFLSLNENAEELLKLLTASIKTARNNLNH